MLDAGLGEVLTTLEKLDWMVQYGEKYLKAEKRPYVVQCRDRIGAYN